MKIWINNTWTPWQEIPKPQDSSLTEAVLDLAELWESGCPHFPFLTSGSTGAPKHIELSRQAIQWVLDQSNHVLNWKEKQNQLLALHPNRIGGAMAVFRALEANQNVQIWEPSMPWSEHFFTPQLMSLVPYQLQKIFQLQGASWLEQCGVILLGGGPVSDSLIHKINTHKLRVFQSYGMTETASMIAIRQLSPSYQSHFTPLPGVSIHQDENGQLIVNGLQTENRDIFTNDLIKTDEKSGFTVLGRVDEVINSGGIKWYVPDLESKIADIVNMFPLISAFFIWKAADDTFGEVVVLGIETNNANSINHQLLMNYLDEKMPHHALPRQIKYFEKLLRNGNEKLNRKQNWEAPEIKYWKK